MLDDFLVDVESWRTLALLVTITILHYHRRDHKCTMHGINTVRLAVNADGRGFPANRLKLQVDICERKDIEKTMDSKKVMQNHDQT